jgi:dienelactone hydrolase
VFKTTRRLVACLVAAGFVLAPAAAAPAGALSPAICCNEQPVEIQANGYTIPGTFTMPRAGGAHAHYPTVLLLHGTASQKDEVGNMYLRLAQKLGALGYASLRIDFAGSGDSTLPQTAFSYTEEVSDAETALTWLSRNPNVDANALGLVGFSQGGRVAATVAGTDSRVKAVATWSTWVEDGSTAYLVFGPAAYQQAQQNGQVTVDLGFRTWTFSLAFFDSIKNSHPLQDIANYRGPLLGIDGSDDFLWPQTKQELFAAGSYDETLHVVPGADHIYHVLGPDQTQAEDVMHTTATWFAENLAPDVRNGH